MYFNVTMLRPMLYSIAYRIYLMQHFIPTKKKAYINLPKNCLPACLLAFISSPLCLSTYGSTFPSFMQTTYTHKHKYNTQYIPIGYHCLLYCYRSKHIFPYRTRTQKRLVVTVSSLLLLALIFVFVCLFISLFVCGPRAQLHQYI